MSDLNYSDWAIIAFILGLMVVYCFFFGHYLVQAIVRLDFRKRLPSYRKWDVERDVFWPMSPQWFVGLGIVNCLFTSIIILVALLIEIPRIGLPGIDNDPKMFTIAIAFYAFFLGFSAKAQSIINIWEKIKKLEDLREVFGQRFGVVELLSMYESLRFAPQMFWEEYSKLPDEDINEETNRKYRELAAPYRYAQSSKHSRTVITVATGTLALTAVLVVIEVFL